MARPIGSKNKTNKLPTPGETFRLESLQDKSIQLKTDEARAYQKGIGYGVFLTMLAEIVFVILLFAVGVIIRGFLP